jgi:hypothetical protein
VNFNSLSFRYAIIPTTARMLIYWAASGNGAGPDRERKKQRGTERLMSSIVERAEVESHNCLVMAAQIRYLAYRVGPAKKRDWRPARKRLSSVRGF